MVSVAIMYFSSILYLNSHSPFSWEEHLRNVKDLAIKWRSPTRLPPTQKNISKMWELTEKYHLQLLCLQPHARHHEEIWRQKACSGREKIIPYEQNAKQHLIKRSVGWHQFWIPKELTENDVKSRQGSRSRWWFLEPEGWLVTESIRGSTGAKVWME